MSKFQEILCTYYLWSWLSFPMTDYVLRVLWMTSYFYIMGANRDTDHWLFIRCCSPDGAGAKSALALADCLVMHCGVLCVGVS